jgi:hypothetical protein
MKKLEFKIEINAPAMHVYETMLGLKNKQTYQQWTSVFNPTSTFEGTWEKGSKILFIGFDDQGKRGGLASEIEEHQVAKFISIKHKALIDGDSEISTGPLVESWTGGHENYSFHENNGITTVTVTMDTNEEYIEYFSNSFPKALEQLKKIIE